MSPTTRPTPIGRLRAAARVLALAGLLLAAGCSAPAADDAEAYPSPGGVAAIVTRIVQQVTVVTTTPGPEEAPPPVEEPVELDLSLEGRLPNLDPQYAENQAQLDLAQNLFAGLTNYNAATNTIEPELAASWEVGPDGRTWTFNLRDDIYWVRPAPPLPGSEALWSDTRVRPVTADDVVFAVQRLCSREVESSVAFALFIVEGCEQLYAMPEPTEADLANIGARAVDDTTLEVRLTKPAGYFLTLTSMPLFQPVPRDLVTEFGDEWRDPAGEFSTGWQTPENLVTSGPYLLLPGTVTSQSLTLERNPDWPIDRAGNADIVNVYFFNDEADAYEMWDDRGLDIAPLPSSEREALLDRTGDKMIQVPGEALFYIGFDFGSQVFREPEVRRAFSAAIDRDRLIEEIYDGRALAMRHATVPVVIGAIPINEVGVGYSPDYARQQMDASTFRSCRLMPPVTFLVSSADLSLRQAELMRDMWVEELGCPAENINIEQVNFGALLAATRPDAVGRPDMWELAWAPTFPDAHNILDDLLHCADSENRQNRECSEADTLLRRASSTLDPAERAAIYREAENLFFSETGIYPIIPLYIRATEIVVHDWVTFSPVGFGGQQWDTIGVDASLKELERSRS